MSPSEYLRIKQTQQEIIEAAEDCIAKARHIARNHPPPIHRRAILPGDIEEGAIIWHSRDPDHGGDYWNVVVRPIYASNDLNAPPCAYDADDGCRYGITKAYVEITPKAQATAPVS